MEVSSRPLTGSAADASLYVRRPADRSLDHAVELGLNTLISAPRGAGATSALYRLEADHASRSTYLSLPGAGSAEEVLEALAARLGQARDPMDAPHQMDRLRSATTWAYLRHRLERRDTDLQRPWLALLDGPVPAETAHQLFGANRDELFGLPLRWVVVAPAERIGQYQAPPADVFFEHVVHLDGFGIDGIRQLLDRRGVLGHLGSDRADEVVVLGDGMPRRTLALARRAVLNPSEKLSEGGYTEWLERRAALSQSAATLFDLLQGAEPVTASDPSLLKQLGWSEMRVRRALQELSEGGLVRASQGRSTGPGRPPTVYQIGPGPPGYQTEESIE